jgi:hypothetical protein
MNPATSRTRRNSSLDTTFDYSGRSKESVKARRKIFVLAPAAVTLGLILAQLAACPADAQAALTVGSVRDQSGVAIAGATVEGYDPAGVLAGSARTDGSGTFALTADRVASVAIGCHYCLATRIPVVSGRPVVAIVRRFGALLDKTPSPSDLANLPYSRVESSIGLRPFTLLRQTTEVVSGSQLSDLGFAPGQALLVDAGVPSYDVVDGTSPYDAIPANATRDANVSPASDAFLYGDRAGSGTVFVDPFGDGNEQVGVIGGASSLRFQIGTPQAGAVLTASNGATDWRQRFDAQFQTQLATTQTLGFNASTSQYRETDASGSALDGAYSFARGAFDDAAPGYDFNVAAVTDRGTYGVTGVQGTYDSIWADSGITAGVRTRGSTFAFADTGVRLSSGYYDTAGDLYDATGNIVQRRIDAGFESDQPDYNVVAGVGVFGIDYNGEGWASSGGARAALATPSLQLRLFPDQRWSGSFAAAGSFSLPTVVDQYDGYANHSLAYDRGSSYAGTLSYTDFSRVRVEVEAASQRVTGFSNGLVTSAGMSVTWQVAPAIALRAWTMRVNDATTSPVPPPFVPSYGPFFGVSNVNAFWLTYENPGAIRFDAIYRRDLLNGEPFEHIDGDVSGPIASSLRWYAGIENVARTKYISAGLKFNP